MGSQIEQIGVDIEEVGTAIRSIRYVTTAAPYFSANSSVEKM